MYYMAEKIELGKLLDRWFYYIDSCEKYFGNEIFFIRLFENNYAGLHEPDCFSQASRN